MAQEPFKTTAVGIVFLGVVSCAIWAFISGDWPRWKYSSPSISKEPSKDDEDTRVLTPAVGQVDPAPKPQKTVYKVTPTPPTSGAMKGTSVVIDECHRPDIYHIVCTGQLTNTTDAPEAIYLGDSTVVDDQGNSFFINGTFEGAGGFTYGDVADGSGGGGGAFQPLMPGVAYKFSTHIKDAHQNVGVLNLMLHFQSGHGSSGTLTFPSIQVQ